MHKMFGWHVVDKQPNKKIVNMYQNKWVYIVGYCRFIDNSKFIQGSRSGKGDALHAWCSDILMHVRQEEDTLYIANNYCKSQAHHLITLSHTQRISVNSD